MKKIIEFINKLFGIDKGLMAYKRNMTWEEKKYISEIQKIDFGDNPSVAEYIVIHHSLSEDGEERNWEAIRKYHKETKGWDDIGYHFGVERVGDDFVVMKGRPMNKRGAHVKDGGFNWKSVGICVVGNYDTKFPPDRQLVLTRMLCMEIMELLNIGPDNVIGHREAQMMAGVNEEERKSCPGRQFDMTMFRNRLKMRIGEVA